MEKEEFKEEYSKLVENWSGWLNKRLTGNVEIDIGPTKMAMSGLGTDIFSLLEKADLIK